MGKANFYTGCYYFKNCPWALVVSGVLEWASFGPNHGLKQEHHLDICKFGNACIASLPGRDLRSAGEARTEHLPTSWIGGPGEFDTTATSLYRSISIPARRVD